MIQCMVGAQPGTIIRYNWLHDSRKYGARFDGNGAGNNGTMHHNVMWNLGNSGIMAKGYEHKIYNNTVLNGPSNKNDILVMIAQGGNAGTITQNNVANRIAGHRSGSYQSYPVPGTILSMRTATSLVEMLIHCLLILIIVIFDQNQIRY